MHQYVIGPDGRTDPYTRERFAEYVVRATNDRRYFPRDGFSRAYALGLMATRIAEAEGVVFQFHSDAIMAREVGFVLRDRDEVEDAWRFVDKRWRLDGPWYNSPVSRLERAREAGVEVTDGTSVVPEHLRRWAS